MSFKTWALWQLEIQGIKICSGGLGSGQHEDTPFQALYSEFHPPKTSTYYYRVDDIHKFCQTFLEVNHTFYFEARILPPVLHWKEEFLTLKATLGMNVKHISLQMQCKILLSCAFETTLNISKILNPLILD